MKNAKDETKYGGIGDASVKRATGKTWREWVRVLDAAGGRNLDHKGIVAIVWKRFRRIGGWWAQMVTVGYEQAVGHREPNQTTEGFEAHGSKTLPVSLSSLYRAWSDDAARRRWLGAPRLSVSKATRPKSIRIVWHEPDSRVDVYFVSKGAAKSQVAVQHRRLPSQASRVRMQAYWKERLGRLEKALGGA